MLQLLSRRLLLSSEEEVSISKVEEGSVVKEEGGGFEKLDAAYDIVGC